MHGCAFSHLQARSEYSLLLGIPDLKALVARAKAAGMPALALTDRNRMSGLVIFHEECRAKGIKPILGLELDEPARPRPSYPQIGDPQFADSFSSLEILRRQKLAAKRSANCGQTLREGPAPRPLAGGPGSAAAATSAAAGAPTVVVLARNYEGYGDLCELATRRLKDADTFAFASVFAKPWSNLVFLTASLPCLRLLANGPNRWRLHGALVRNSEETRARSREVEAYCDAEGLPVVASGDVYFLDKQDHELHRIVRAIDLNSTLSRLKPGETAPEGSWFRTEAQMRELFHDRPDAIDNAGAIAERCNAAFPPRKWVMPVIKVPRNQTPDSYLAKLALRGLWRKYGGKPTYGKAREIQEKELRVIRKLGYSSYFLMVKEVRDWASSTLRTRYRRSRDCSILRGSGANSITFYNTGVCNLDPIKLGLYFERFLNEDRAAPPDADLDFGWDERDAALKWMVERFGRDRVAITCTTNHFRSRAAFREVGKVFGYSDEQITSVLDSFDTNARRLDDDGIRKVLAWARRIKGKPRFLGQHPGGLIITNEPVWRHVGCEWSKEGGEAAGARLVTQVDMHNGIDELGLIKFDLLGNGSLSVLRDTLKQIEEQDLPDPEVWDVEKCFRDPDVRDMLVDGRSRGIFYIESPAQIRLNQKAMTETFDEVVITSSLIRPAGTAYCKSFVERHRKMKQGIQDWEFVHPELEKILAETHDVCAFQEDVIRICHEVAGLPYKEADRIRKMMNSQHEGAPGAKDWEATRLAFIAGCGRKGLNEAQAAELWKRVSSFTGFSFCKSHSASYAELSFQCAHLKNKYPAQFLSAVISNRHGFYTRDVYLDEARRWGLRILPLDVNHSRLAYFGKDDWIRPGLMPVRDCREAALRLLVDERERAGRPYADLIDLLKRVPLHKREAENLILAGAMGSFGMTQPELLYLLDAAYPKLAPAQPGLFDEAAIDAGLDEDGYDWPKLGEYSEMRRCMNELRMLGYVLSANVLDVIDVHPLGHNAVRAEDLKRHVGRRIRVVGIPVTDRLHPLARDGRNMMFLTLGDSTGYMDVIFWPDALDRWNDVLVGQVPFSGNILEIHGKVSEDWGTYSVEAERVGIIEWMPNQLNFELLASRRLREGMRNYPAYANGVAIAA